MILGIGITLSTTSSSIGIQIIGVLVSLILSSLIIFYQRRRVFEIKFQKEFIEIEFINTKRKLEVSYSELLKIRYISVMRNPIRNEIQFRNNGKVKKLKFLTVKHSDEFVEFVKWLKSKNEKIEWEVFPSDNIMNHKLQEVYGFKYRKILKKTL